MTPIEQIHAHRSLRTFEPRPIADSVLDEIFAAASRAPTAASMQLYTAIVTTDPARREALAAVHFGVDSVRQAPAVITFCIDLHRIGRWLALAGETSSLDNAWGLAMGYSDALLTAQTAAIAAESLGLGTCFLGSTVAAAPMLCSFFALPPHVLPVATMVLGYPKADDVPSAPSSRLPVRTVFHRETYERPSDDDLRAAYADHARATFAMYARMPSNAAAVSAFGIDTLEALYTRLSYPADLLDLSGTYFLATMKLQGFLSQAKFARAAAAQAAMTDPTVASLPMTRQLVFSLALATGALDAHLTRAPGAIEAELYAFVNASDPPLYDDFGTLSLFHPVPRARFQQVLATFNRMPEQAAAE